MTAKLYHSSFKSQHGQPARAAATGPGKRRTTGAICPQRDIGTTFLPPNGNAAGACPDADGDEFSTCAGDCDDSDPYRPTNRDPGCNREACRSVEGCNECGPHICRRTAARGRPFPPVLVDVAGDGFELTDKSDGVRLGLNDDGERGREPRTATGPDDAWRALDRNGNGTIDGGAELFGEQTPHPPTGEPDGFKALAEYDRPSASATARWVRVTPST